MVKTEIATLVLNSNGKIALEFSTAPEAMAFLAPMFTKLMELPQSVDQRQQQQQRYVDDRTSKRGLKVTDMRLNNARVTSDEKKKRERRPRLCLTPRKVLEYSTLIYKVEDAVDAYWELVRRSRKDESRSSVFGYLYELYFAETGYRASEKRTLGRVSQKCRRLHTIILDGKADDFIGFVLRLTREVRSGMVAI